MCMKLLRPIDQGGSETWAPRKEEGLRLMMFERRILKKYMDWSSIVEQIKE